MIWVVVDKICDRLVLREDHSVSERCQRSCPRWPLSQITQNTVVYGTVWDRLVFPLFIVVPSTVDLVQKVTFSDLKLSLERKQRVYRAHSACWESYKKCAWAALKRLFLLLLLYWDRNTQHNTRTNTSIYIWNFFLLFTFTDINLMIMYSIMSFLSSSYSSCYWCYVRET